MLHWSETTRSKDIKAHRSKVSFVSWNTADDKKIASGAVDSMLKVWTIHNSGKEFCMELRGHRSGIVQLCWDPKINTDRLLSASTESVRFWDTKNGKCISSLSTPGENLHACISPDGKYALVGNKNDTLSLIDLREYKIIQQTNLPVEINEMSFNPAGTLIYASSNSNEILILHPYTLSLVATIPTNVASYCLQFDPKGRYFALGTGDALTSIWDVEESLCTRCIPVMDYPARTFAFNFEGEYIALGSEDPFVAVCKVETGELAWKIPCTNAINSVSWNPTKNLLAYSTDEINVRTGMSDGIFRIFGYS